MDKLQQKFEAIAGSALPDWTDFTGATRTGSYPKNSTVFCEGDVVPWLFVLQSGLIKLHYNDAQGNEKIKSFVAEGGIFASTTGLLTGGGVNFWATALEPSQVLRIPYETLKNLAAGHLQWSQFLIALLTNYSAQKERREHGFLMHSATERYLALISENPAIIARASQKDIASYLGITPVGLSRIKSRLNRKTL